MMDRPVSRNFSAVTTRQDETEGTKAMSVSVSSEVHGNQPGRNGLRARETLSASHPRHASPVRDSRPQVEEPAVGVNVGAAKRGGVVRWFDEEVQLLMKLRDQDKSWEDVFDVSLLGSVS